MKYLSRELSPFCYTRKVRNLIFHDTFEANTCSSIVVHLSLITTTMPRIYSYIATLQAGLLNPRVPERRRLPSIQPDGSDIERSEWSK
jgi:hypothetical protein